MAITCLNDETYAITVTNVPASRALQPAGMTCKQYSDDFCGVWRYGNRAIALASITARNVIEIFVLRAQCYRRNLYLSESIGHRQVTNPGKP